MPSQSGWEHPIKQSVPDSRAVGEGHIHLVD